ncbi:hypothetical protein Q5P01_013234 [Channa striata]|uniref:Uncharacterized protein n=1 Tax=Channa striata TaxID=64152 RepID=A0AA88MNS0_CHASR|nr:hypothetical protein Q5P01_013234 [Channa striata]
MLSKCMGPHGEAQQNHVSPGCRPEPRRQSGSKALHKSSFHLHYGTSDQERGLSLSWLSGRVHAEVRGNSPGLLQTVVVRKSLSLITGM